MISIHTPAKGVTEVVAIDTTSWRISIHTPAKGVTASTPDLPTRMVNFNPHSREGSDQTPDSTLHTHRGFQSTLPRRE